MKKLFLKFLFVTVVSVISITSFLYLNVTQKPNNTLVLENIKAIADSESGGAKNYVFCNPYNVVCAITNDGGYIWGTLKSGTECPKFT